MTTEKTKRLLIIVEFLLVVFAASAMLFAPNEKEKVTYIIGAILLVLALGIIGASKFVIKFFGLTVETKHSGLPLNAHPKFLECQQEYSGCKSDTSTRCDDKYDECKSDTYTLIGEI